MDSNTIRTALGQLQDDPDLEEAWTSLRSSVSESRGDLDTDELLNLLEAAKSKHQERGEWDAVAYLLDIELNAAAGSAREIDVARELAQVHGEQRLDDAAAEAAFFRVLELSEDDEAATSAIEEAEEKKGRWEELRATYTEEAENAPDDVYKSSMLMRAAEMELRYSEGDKNGIAQRLEEALSLDPTNARAAHMLERVYRDAEKWEETAQVLDRVSKAVEGPARVAALVRLARLQALKLADREAAVSSYGRLLEIDPDSQEAMSFVAEHYSAEERWEDLVALYEKQLKSADLSSSERIGDMLQIAMLHWRKLEKPEGAEPWFDRIRKIDAGQPLMVNFYREYLAETGDEGRLVSILQSAARVMPESDEKKEIQQQLAQLAESQQDAQKAIEQYKGVLRADPENSEARDALKRLYRQTEGYNALVELLRQELERAPKDDAEVRLPILKEVATLYRQAIKSDTALVSVLNQIVALDSENIEAVSELVELYEKLGRWRDLLTNQTRLAGLKEDIDEKKELYRDVARRWLDQFSNVQNAMEAYKHLLDVAPDDEEAVEKLHELYRKRRAWPQLFELYGMELERAEGERRIEVLKEMAELAAVRLRKEEEAIKLYKQILEADPEQTEALDALERQAERAKNWPVLAEALEKRVEMVEGKERLQVLQKLGGVYADHLEDAEGAVRAWRRVLEIQPGNNRAMRVLRDTYLGAKDFDGLADLYGSQDDFEGLAEVLSSAADKAGDDAEKIALSYRAAAVYEEQIGAPDRAFRSYERILQTDPKDARAATALIPLYEADEKWSRLPPLYEVLLEQAEGDDEKLDWLRKLVEVSGDKLNNSKAAAEYAGKAYELAPANEAALELLEETSRAAGAWDGFVAVIEGRLTGDDAPEGDEARSLRIKLARVYADELGRSEEAIASYKELVEADPTDGAAAGALEEILRREGKRDELRWLLNLRVENSEEDGTRVRILGEWATLEEEVFEENDKAAALYRRVLELDGEDAVALRALPRLLMMGEDFAGAAEVIERHRDLLDGADRAEREVELSELYLRRLERPKDALDAAVRALDLSPREARAMSVLDRLVEIDETKSAAARVLAREYATGEDARREAQALDVLLETTTERDKRLELFARLTDVHEEKLEAYGTAFNVVLRAVNEYPDELGFWDRADALATLSGRPTDLAEAYRTMLSGELGEETESELCERAAALHEDKLGDPIGATPYLERGLKLNPGNESAFGRLKDILTAAERWAELEKLYDEASRATDDPVRKTDMLVEVALICEEIIEDEAKATGYYERILEIDPLHDQSVRALDRLYAMQERHADLATLLERRIETAEGEELLEFKKRVAALRLEKLHQPDQAVGYVEDVLTEQIGDYEARELAEKMLEIGSLRARAARMLETVYEEREEMRDLVRVLGVRLETLAPSEEGEELDPAQLDERKELLRRVASLRDERLHDDEGALDALAELVPLDPMDTDARSRLLEVGRRVGSHQRVAEVLTKAADAADSTEVQGEVLMQVAQIYEDLLDDLHRAETTYRRVLELDPDNAELALPAAKALERIYTGREEHQKLAEMLRVQVRLEPDGDERSALLGRLGELSQTVLEDNDGAIEAWRARLEENPGDGDALIALDELYQRTEKWTELVEILDRRQDATTDSDERKALMMRKAETLSNKLENVPDAIEAWRAVVDEFGPSLETLPPLEKLYEGAERWDELAEAYESHLDLVSETSDRMDLLARLGDLRRQHLSNLEGALEAYRDALTVDSQHAPSRSALEKLLEVDDNIARAEAADVLHPIYEEEGAHEALLRVLEIKLVTADDPLRKLECLDEAIRVADDRLEDQNRAFGYAQQAVRVAVGHTELAPWLEKLERLAGGTQKQAEYVQLLCEVVPDIFDGDVQLEVTLKIADMARHTLADRELAREYYQKALDIQSDSRSALVALESLYEEAGDGQNLLDILERRVEAAETDEEKKELLYRRARLLAEVLEEPARAIEVYETILDLNLDEPALEALEGLYTKSERWDDLVMLYQRQLDEGPEDAPGLHVKIARVCAQRQNDVARAFDEIEAALEHDNQHADAITELERLLKDGDDAEQHARAASLLEPVYLRRADYTRVMDTITARLEYSQDPEERRDLLSRLAQLYEEQKEDYVSALETTAKLLHEDLSDQATVSELERLAKVAGAEKRLAEVYAAEIEEVVTDESQARLARRCGELFAELGESDEALTYYRRALAFEPESRELFDAIDGLLIKTEKHEERVALYRDALEHRFDPDERLETLHIIAALQRNELKQPDEAIDTYVSCLDVAAEDVRALDALTELYRERERWDDLSELYLRRAETAEVPRDGAMFRLALARLLKQELTDPDRAIDQLEEIVRSLPSNTEAVKELEAFLDDEERKERVVEILRPLYESADDWRHLIKLNEDRYELAEDPVEKVAVLRETAGLWEERGGDQTRARRALGAAFEIDPDDADVRGDLERLAEETDAWDELSATYEQVLEKQPDIASKREILATLAQVHDKRRDDPRSALDAYVRLRQVDETDLEPVERIERLSMLLSDWKTLVDVLVAKADLVFEDDERASTWRRVGEARRDMLEDPAGAIQAYERAIEFDPESAFTLDNLIELYEAKDDAQRLVELYERRVELTGEDDDELKYELLVSAARCHEEKLEDRQSAIDALTQALGVRPGDRDVLRSLNRLYRAQEMWPDLLDNLRLEASAEETAEGRASLRKEIGSILASQLHSHDDALEAYRLVLDEVPGDKDARASVRKIGEEHEHLRETVAEILVPVLRGAEAHEELVDILELRLTTESDPAARAETLRTIAEVFESRLGKPSDALDALLRALAETPDAGDLHSDIERLAAASSGWGAYADALTERAEGLFDPEIARDLYNRLGQLCEDKLEDDERAVRAFTRAVEQAGDQPDLLSALDRLYGKLGDAQNLSEILERRVLLEESEGEQAELHYRLAKLQIDEFKEPARALGSLRMALERAPDHEDAAQALEGLTDDRDLFEEAAEVLEAVYRDRGQTDRLAALYEKRVGFADSPADRIDMRRSLARVLEDDCSDAGAAQRVLQLGLSDDPSDNSLLDELERLAPITGNWEGAAAALRDAIEKKDDLTPDVAKELCLKLAEWYRDKVEDTEAAEKALGKALEHDPESDDVLVQLDQLQRGPGRERDLIETLRRRARLQLDEGMREELFRQAKDHADGLDDKELAEKILREFLEQDDSNLWALSELTELREAAEDYKETFDLLVRRSELRAHAELLTELRHRAAAIAREKLDDAEKAIELYDMLFEDTPRDAKASDALRDLYAKQERWDDLSRLLERLVDLADDVELRGTLRMELAKLSQERFNANDDAIDLLRAVLEDEPSRAEAVVALSELYEKTERDEELAELLNEQISSAKDRDDTEAELKFQVRLGEVYESRLNDTTKAIDTYNTVLERDAEHRGALEALARLHEAAGNNEDAAEALAKLLDQSESEQAVELAGKLADVYEKLEDRVKASAALERGLEHDERNADLRDRLKKLYEATETWDSLANLIAGDADHAEEVDAKVKLLREAADIHADKRDDQAAAAELLEKASEAKPDDRELMLALCDAYSASGRGKAAVEVLEKIVESYGGKRSKELGDIHRRLATAYLADGETQRALEELDKAFRIEPGNVYVLKQLGEVSLEAEDLKKAQQMFRALLLQKLDASSPITKAEVFMNLGVVHHKLGEKPKAIQMLERAISSDSSLEKAKELLAEVKG